MGSPTERAKLDSYSTYYHYIIKTGYLEVISDIDILNIVDGFDWNHLEYVYTHLGLDHTSIQNERLGPTRSKPEVKNILHMWCNKEGHRATREWMIAAIEQVPECRASLDRLKEKWNIRSPGEYDRIQ